MIWMKVRGRGGLKSITDSEIYVREEKGGKQWKQLDNGGILDELETGLVVRLCE